MSFETVEFRRLIWQKLKEKFDSILKCSCSNEISYADVEKILRYEVDQDELSIEFTMKSTFKFDMDGNGKVSFDELGNFLLRRHCREISLQKYHREKNYKGDYSHWMNRKDF